ncbi:MAG: hypothetical protein JW751_01120 [Polyangiaceae bacterium]|nr:hypothetical protein [Polyangiaceae bacterium]
MVNGAPPSSVGGSRGSDRFGSARGSIRDALGSLQNLEQLLKSIKVGPRALASVIPAVHASCTPLLASFGEVLAALAPLGEAPVAVETFITPRLAALERALAEAMGTPLHARQRLSLESAVTRAATDLETGRALVDLLEGALAGPAMRVSLVEATRSMHRPPDGAAASAYDRVSALLSTAEVADVTVNPRVAAELVGIAVRMVAGAHPECPPHVDIGIDSDRRVVITVSSRSADGEPVHLFAPRLVEPTMVSAQAAAHATHGEITLHPDGTVSLSWPAIAGE